MELRKRAKLEILNYITMFCLSTNYGDNVNRGGFGDSYFLPTDNPNTGDLVALKSAPYTEWYLSWYVDRLPSNKNSFDVHVLESIESGKLCNWSNVSFSILNRDVLNKNPQWKWTDRQYKLRDRWWRVCGKNKISFCLYGDSMLFDEKKVTLNIRRPKYHNDITYVYDKRQFNDWRKVRVKDMQQFWDDILKKYRLI